MGRFESVGRKLPTSQDLFHSIDMPPYKEAAQESSSHVPRRFDESCQTSPCFIETHLKRRRYSRVDILQDGHRERDLKGHPVIRQMAGSCCAPARRVCWDQTGRLIFHSVKQEDKTSRLANTGRCTIPLLRRFHHAPRA